MNDPPRQLHLALVGEVCYFALHNKILRDSSSNGTTMNKTELIDKVAKESALSIAAAEQVVNNVFSAIADAMKTGDKVTLVGFGTFSVSERAAREGRNPKSGKTIIIPAKKVVKFKAGSKLVDSVK
ncbi:MAG: HU family DNA-binding protein [Desulfobulbus sp.]|jgi:DNA-binding protein HU-beta|nr:HU family DNA-binding protein [Desulfobulbus sp.]